MLCLLLAGHFDWAPRPDEEVFAETPVPATTAAAAADSSDDEDEGVPGEDNIPSPLHGADPENTEVLVRKLPFSALCLSAQACGLVVCDQNFK